MRRYAGWRESVEQISDIDAPYRDAAVQLVPEYAQSNIEYMREQEVRSGLSKDYFPARTSKCVVLASQIHTGAHPGAVALARTLHPATYRCRVFTCLVG